MKRNGMALISTAAMLLMTALPSLPQEHGEGGGGCGDVFGDLIHIQRDSESGQPVLAKRFVELPKEVEGYGWGYCPIALDAGGGEIGFLPYSCDIVDPDAAVEVDYFGRLSGGRTKEKNHRMHFDEVISNIKMADWVKQEPATGRLMMGFDCQQGNGNSQHCDEWKVIDSPMESMALYTRLMKYGHLQTDPAEIDVWWHGDPATSPEPTHPALGPTDWDKFHNSVRQFLPADGEVGCYGEDGTFNATCGEPESLTDRDFVQAAAFLGAAANKTGIITRDLVQFVNRILRITVETQHTASNPNTLPALVRDCEDPNVIYGPPDEGDPNPSDPIYFPIEECDLYEAYAELDNYEHFFDVQERFVDFYASEYDRGEWREENFDELILPTDLEGAFEVVSEVALIPWLAYVNGPDPDDPYFYETTFGLKGFVEASSDALRAIEFIHNFEVPVELMPAEEMEVTDLPPVSAGS